MAFPSSLDSLTNPLASDPRVGHAALHGSVNDAVEALEAKVGIRASTPDNASLLMGTDPGESVWSTPATVATALAPSMVTALEAAGYGLLHKATATLSSADILALDSTPQTLVAAPGAGKFIVPHKVVAQYVYGTVAYVVGAQPDVTWEGSSVAGTLSLNLSGGADVLCFITPAMSNANPVDIVNKALTLSAGDPLTDGDGTLTVTVWYSVEDVPA